MSRGINKTFKFDYNFFNDIHDIRIYDRIKNKL